MALLQQPTEERIFLDIALYTKQKKNYYIHILTAYVCGINIVSRDCYA